ncbi:STAS domain-containing protein [Streptomyces boluensis]|uniref:Anti-sigma factor antagonist n=1 Tax=Streptomyces boluensis TaxID=1775135 RepID=A0A964UP17_9ACTN|nr:STAS domain-containing protein [Streptomyces boluensis]NBE52167.1 anti-sigma factor antagonist [Streptomyces boluensis]
MEIVEPAFGMRHRLMDDTLVLVLHGEIDAWAQQVLGPRLTRLLAERPSRQVVVDLRPVTFLDASGLRLLVRIRRHCVARGTRACLVRGVPRVWRVLQLTRLDVCFDAWDALPAEWEEAGPCGLCGAPFPCVASNRRAATGGHNSLDF